MDLRIIEEEENPLLERHQIRFKVDHSNAPTPPRSKVREELASTLSVPEDNIIIEKVATLHGTQSASGIARVYETEEKLKEIEPKHLIERAKAAEAKPKEEKPEEEEVEEAPEEAEEEEAPEEKPEEEAEEEAPEEESEEAEEKGVESSKPKEEEEEDA